MHPIASLQPTETWLLNYLLNSLWQLPLLFAAAWLATRALRRSGPEAQHRIWVSTLILQLLLPACTLSPRQLLHTLASLIPWHNPHETTNALITITTGPVQAHNGLELSTLLVTLIVGAYALTLLYFAARLFWGLRNTAALCRATQPVPLTEAIAATWSRCAQHFNVPNAQLAASINAPYPLTIGIPSTGVPTIGLRHPLILLPTGFASTVPSDDLAAALAHEFAHIHRRDFAKNLVYALLSIPIAWHPALWLTRKHIEETREMVCDALAAEALTGSQPYARSLLRLAALFVNAAPHRNLHAIGIFDASIFERRVMNLTHKPIQLRGLRRIALTAACLTLGVATCASALALRMNVSASSSDAHSPSPQTVKTLKIAPRVMNGQRISFIEPVYPTAAKKAKLSGTVVLAAVIGKDGRMKSLHVISGPEPFRKPALDAVRKWTYKPYLLNGNPTEVETHITVNFSLAVDPAQAPAPSTAPNPSASNSQSPAVPNQTMHIGGAVKPPIVVSQVDPEYSQQAKDAKFSGTVEVYLWVDKNGHPTHVRVVKGVGMGLDEEAVNAVRQYKFKPATRDGQPVAVDLYIDVNFQML